MRQQQPTWATPPLDLRHHKWPLELDGANRRLLAPTAGVSTAAATLRFHRKPFCRLNFNLTARDKNNQTLGLDQSARARIKESSTGRARRPRQWARKPPAFRAPRGRLSPDQRTCSVERRLSRKPLPKRDLRFQGLLDERPSAGCRPGAPRGAEEVERHRGDARDLQIGKRLVLPQRPVGGGQFHPRCTGRAVHLAARLLPPSGQVQWSSFRRVDEHVEVRHVSEVVHDQANRPAWLIRAWTSSTTQWRIEAWMLSVMPMSARSTWMPSC